MMLMQQVAKVASADNTILYIRANIPDKYQKCTYFMSETMIRADTHSSRSHVHKHIGFFNDFSKCFAIFVKHSFLKVDRIDLVLT